MRAHCSFSSRVLVRRNSQRLSSLHLACRATGLFVSCSTTCGESSLGEQLLLGTVSFAEEYKFMCYVKEKGVFRWWSNSATGRRPYDVFYFTLVDSPCYKSDP